MAVVELDIYRNVGGTETLVAKANKWKFQDVVMGEQFITCTVTSETPIEWEIGDHCTFRGETYTLNYVPSVTQKAPIDSVQDAFTYENVKFDSFQDELTRCMMLDVTPTTPQYQAVLGTNHTGSSRFQLYCGETTVNGSTLTAVCALALKMQANLDRLYPNAWHIHVDTTTTYTTASGEYVLVTHTDSKLLTFDNQTVAQALGLVHTEFKLDYCIKGRNIYIGYSIDSTDPINPIEDLTADDVEDRFVFGYGRGYADVDNQGKSLFQIKQIANSQQKIVTRLRALGSTKNLPYNYYFKKYGLLSQALFPTNLQLPGTFLPLGTPSDTADADGNTKWAQNNARSQYLRKVLGDTNDSYIDKNDDAASCVEGIREDCARWDGSNGDLPEIYPTIEGVTFGELRDAGVPDQTGETGDGAYQGDNVQPDEERVDCLLAVGYTDGGVLIDDANVGDGVMPENEVVDTGTHFAIGIGQTRLVYNAQSGHGDFEESGMFLKGAEQVLFTVNDVTPGNYFMVPTGPSYSCVAYRFSINAQNNASADVGFVIRVKQKVGNTYTTLVEWYSDFVTANTVTGEKELYLPEIPDQATSGQVSAITVTALSDIIVTFAPLMQNASSSGQFALTYMVGRSQSGEYDPEYTWSAVQGDVASKYPFHVFIKDMGFDLTATFNGETPIMAMKSGMCVGREFEIGENVQKATVNGIRGYLLTLNRVEDSNLHIYYPNEYYRLSAGDYFVLLNINMPDAYIRAAELRLLKAATEYLADNCETKYTYQPSIDDIYLQRNYDIMEAAGTREKSIFWRLYAGLKFRFNGIPSNASASDSLPLVSMTIEQVAITMGDGLTAKVELTLNDDVQQTTLQKLTVAVDRIYNGSIFSSGGAGTNMEAVVDICSRLFLSKTHDDTANGRITFNDIATFVKLLKAKDGIDIGTYLSGFLGSGAHIGSDGRAEFEEVNVRGAIRAAELIFNRISAEEGEAIRSIGHGEILTVDESTCTATLKLDGDEWATIDAGDICRGLYNTVAKDYDNATFAGEDGNGFRMKAGFFASYFRVEEVLTNSKGECSFRYSLQPGTTEHPCELMKFAVYGNFDDNKKDRQSSMYITAVGIAPRLLYLANVNDWQIKPQNIKVALGYLEGLNVYEILNGELSLKTLHGDAGLFVEDNIYFGGILNQFTAADWQYIQDMLGQGLHAQLLRGSDNIVVDALGNVVGGIYTIDTSGTSVVRRYKLHTGVLVYDSGKKMYLKVKPVDDETELKDDEFYLSYSCDGCTALRDGADFYITSIRNTNDGLSETTLTDEQLALMRNTNECRIHFIIATANGWRTQITYPVKITHLDKSYITFNLDNEYDAISYRTQSKRFAGLPIEVNLNAQANGEQLTASAFVSTTIESDLFSGQVVVNGNIDNTKNLPCGIKITTSRSGKVTLSHAFAGAETDMEDSKHYIDISSVVRYAGAEYESGKRRFTLQETTDATIYKLLLSATAISKNDNGYEPNSVDVKLQVWDESGQSVGIPNGTTGQVYVDGVALTDIYVKYVYGTYSPSGNNTYHATPPVLGTDVVTCFTIVALDTNTNSVLDVQSVTINAVGRDGAGQPWLWTNPKSIIVIDCDKDGYPLTNHSETIEARLYWGDTPCGISGSNDVSVEYGGSSQEVSVSNDVASCTISISKLSVLTSSNIVITITGTSNNETHTAQESIAVIANRKGETGNAGAGQSQVIFNTDKKIIDCDSNGSPAVITDFDLSASLVFGEELCELTSATMVWSSDGGDAPDEGQISYSFDVDTAYKRFTFLPTGRYWSGLITVTLTGTLNGVTHTASQTVAVEINKSGKGISSVVTYYKAFILHEGVTAPATNVNPTGDGWSSSYIEPTEECPYLWRFTRTTYTDGSKTQTDCELVQVWSNVVNRNLLSDTEFINGQMSMWNIKGYYSSDYTPVVANIGIASSSSQYNGHNSYRSQFRSNSDEPSNVAITLLGQILYADSGAHIIEEGKWYTLSFMASMYSGTSSYTYGSVNLDINLKGIVDTDSPRYIDGEEQNIGDTVGGTTLDVDNFHYAQFKNTSSGWKKHSFTFKAKPSLANIIEGSNSVPLMVRFMTTGVKSEQRNVYLSVPKLEVGMVATAYEAKRPVNEPISRRDEWAAGVQYYQGSTGEPYMDVVHYNNQWFKCLISHISNSSNKPVEDTLTAFWQPFSSVPFLASGLILGEQGIINLLFSQKIMIYNEANQLAASINQDKKGSYCIYYPETGRKMMEFSAEGFINYFNDNDGNTLEWRLGHGASVADDSTDDWKPVMMKKLSSSDLMFNENAEFTRTEYYYLSAGSSGNYAGFSGLYSTHSNDIPIQQTPLAEGWYTKDVAPWENMHDVDTIWYGIVMLHVTHTQATSGGSTYNVANITEKKIRYFTGTSYVEEVIN